MTIKTIKIASDFSRFPSGRSEAIGPFSGERFRRDFLEPALKSNDKVIVELDGVLGYNSSFLEETFGGLIRHAGYSAQQLREKLEVKTIHLSLYSEIWKYIDEMDYTAREGLS